MHFTLAIPIVMAAIAVALPQGPGGGRAVLGWCATGVPGCAYTSLYDCTNLGGKSYAYCTGTCGCRNRREPKVRPNPTLPKKTLPPSEQLPIVKSGDKTSANPSEDDYTTVAYNEAEEGDISEEGDIAEEGDISEDTTTDDNSDFDYETAGFTGDWQDTSEEDNYVDNSITASVDATQETTDEFADDENTITASTEGSQTSDETDYDYSLTAFDDTTDSGDTAYLDDEENFGFEGTA